MTKQDVRIWYSCSIFLGATYFTPVCESSFLQTNQRAHFRHSCPKKIGAMGLLRNYNHSPARFIWTSQSCSSEESVVFDFSFEKREIVRRHCLQMRMGLSRSCGHFGIRILLWGIRSTIRTTLMVHFNGFRRWQNGNDKQRGFKERHPVFSRGI